MLVFINPGHAPDGNPDPGACANGLRECDVTLKIGLFLSKYLAAAGVGIAGFLQDDSLEKICEEANASNADFFISIHGNAADIPEARGAEGCVFADGGMASAMGRYILSQLHFACRLNDRGIKERPHLWVLHGTNMPALLLEVGFLTNSTDAATLRDKPDDVARAIARGITDFQLRGW